MIFFLGPFFPRPLVILQSNNNSNNSSNQNINFARPFSHVVVFDLGHTRVQSWKLKLAAVLGLLQDVSYSVHEWQGLVTLKKQMAFDGKPRR